MKVLSLHFKNLNSLVGEWHIDFTDAAYIHSGIFAITGPTGAGKTTVLDALCLGLYGQTPRLSRINKNGNEIISRHTGECFAEVQFETLAGRFICHWSQRRARLKPAGELQPPRHEIACADTGQIFETKIRDVTEKIIEITGMDFDRFTRSMLLAQGGFAAFLDATPDERAPILEQITGTEIYSTISIAVHERLRTEREKLDRHEMELKAITVLTDEEEAVIRQEIARKTEDMLRVTREHHEVSAAIDWHRGIEAIQRELAVIERDTVAAKLDYRKFAPDRERLQLSYAAATLDGVYHHLTVLRRMRDDDILQYTDIEQRLIEVRKRVGAGSKKLADAEAEYRYITTLYQESIPRFRTVRELDQKITAVKNSLAEGTSRLQQDQILYNDCMVEYEAEHRSIIAYGKDLERVTSYLDNHAHDAVLVIECTGIIEQIGMLINGEMEIARFSDTQEQQQQKVDDYEKSLVGYGVEITALQEQLHNAQAAVDAARVAYDRLLAGKLLREYRAEYECLLREQLYLEKIAGLEAQRKELEDGKPCPLCGAINHPFASGNIPEATALTHKITALTALIGSIEMQEKNVADLDAIVRKEEMVVREKEKILVRLQSDTEYARHEAVRLTDELTRVSKRQAILHHTMVKHLEQLGINLISERIGSNIIDDLTERRDRWQKAEQEKRVVEKRRDELLIDIKRLEGTIDLLKKRIETQSRNIQELFNDYEQLAHERRDLFDERDPDDEERMLTSTIKWEEETLPELRNANDEAQKELAAIESTRENLKERIARHNTELESIEYRFMQECLGAGFKDEASFLSARLPDEQREFIAHREKQMDLLLADCRSRNADREQALRRERNKQVTGRTLSECIDDQHRIDGAMHACSETIGVIRQRLDANSVAKVQSEEKRLILQTQRDEYRQWENLHVLIGSSDGKKYRNFAQGITFATLLSYANDQMRNLSDRYLLTTDPLQPLEFYVIDSYQAGEVRSARNLSGGEQFVVSLALALGLSRMSSNSVRVDSLFLDEGFGTLDEDALETALETLAELKQEGKLIGVISHVTALQERIPVQIHVTPVSGGRSVMSGPGCQRRHFADSTNSSPIQEG